MKTIKPHRSKFSILDFFGISSPAKKTNPEEILSLLKSLHPVMTEKPLKRLGPKGDGGYLVPEDFEGISACFSPGIADLSSFEKDCADLGMKVFLADKSVNQPADKHELFHFSKIYIGASSNKNFITIDDWVNDSLEDKTSDLLLQMDIEGYEYEVFLSTSMALMNRFRIIVVEFHHLGQFWNKSFFDSTIKPVFEKILKTHTSVHIHPNNYAPLVKEKGIEIPEVMEFTFLRNDRVTPSGYQQQFPHPLDVDNRQGRRKRKTLVLPSCWYRKNG